MILRKVQSLQAHARTSGDWVLLVCGTDDEMMEARRALTAALRPTDKFSGRTAALDPQGHLSIVASSDEPFLDVNFVVTFMGTWEDPNKKDKWRTRAQETLE